MNKELITINDGGCKKTKQTERMMIMKNIFNKDILELIGLEDYVEVVNIPIGFSINYSIVVLKKKDESKLVATHVIETDSINGWRNHIKLDINPTTLKFYDKFFTFIDDVYIVDDINHLINFNNFLLGSIELAKEYGVHDTEEFQKEKEYRVEANKILQKLKDE